MLRRHNISLGFRFSESIFLPCCCPDGDSKVLEPSLMSCVFFRRVTTCREQKMYISLKKDVRVSQFIPIANYPLVTSSQLL